jgi:tripartite-type tricarboxylate transporter receptor subunit TctC
VRNLLLAALLCQGGFAFAQAASSHYPSKPIRWVVPFAAGGPIDVISRSLAQNVSVAVGQPVVTEIRASSAGITGAESVAKAAPDGYTMMSHGSLVPQKFLYKSLPYDLQRDFAPITLIAKAPMVLYVHESVPSKTLNEFVGHLKSQPGKLAYASSGMGQPFHLAFEMFRQRTGTDVLHVPYTGSAQIIPEFLSGRVQTIFFNGVEQLTSQVKAGKLRALAVTGDRRLASLPDVPTFDEAGMRDFDPTGYVATSAPAATPKEIIDRLNREIVRASNGAEVQRTYDRLTMRVVTTTPEQMAQLIREDLEKWGPLIKSLNISLD